MYGSTRVTLSLDELIALRSALKSKMRTIDRLVEISGDPNGVQAEDKAMAEALYKKFGTALKRV